MHRIFDVVRNAYVKVGSRRDLLIPPKRASSSLSSLPVKNAADDLTLIRGAMAISHGVPNRSSESQ